jgi:hypothetical protein
MNYELAKKLEHAGWPQRKHGLKAITDDHTDLCTEPTLEELIEACGKEFSGFERFLDNTGKHCIRDNWRAFGGPGRLNQAYREWEYEHYAFGHTPTEAVAELWLVLNSEEA